MPDLDFASASDASRTSELAEIQGYDTSASGARMPALEEPGSQPSSPQHLDSAVRLLSRTTDKMEIEDGTGHHSHCSSQLGRSRNTAVSRRRSKRYLKQRRYDTSPKGTEVVAEGTYGPLSPSIWSGSRSPTKNDHIFSPEANKEGGHELHAPREGSCDVMVMSARVPSDEIDPLTWLFPNRRILPVVGLPRCYHEFKDRACGSLDSSNLPGAARQHRRVQFGGVTAVSDKPLNFHAPGSVATPAAIQLLKWQESLEQTRSRQAQASDEDEGLDESVLNSPTIIVELQRQIRAESAFAASRSADHAGAEESSELELPTCSEDHYERHSSVQQPAKLKTTAERQDSIRFPSLADSASTAGRVTAASTNASTPEDVANARYGLPRSDSLNSAVRSPVAIRSDASVNERRTSFGFGLDGSKGWQPSSPKSNASIGINHDTASKGNSLSSKAGLSELKKSLRMTPIAKAGESEREAAKRLSQLQVPERPKAKDLAKLSSRRKRAMEQTTLGSLFPVSASSGPSGECDVAHDNENVSPTSTAPSNTATDPLQASTQLSSTATSSEGYRSMPEGSTRHRRSNAVTLNGEEAKRRKS